MKILLCVLLFLTMGFSNTLKEALEAYQNEEYPKAFKIFDKLAQQGNPSAQYNLGVMYYYGDGIEQNKKEAYHFLLKAADQGHLEAQINLDILCEENASLCQ